MQVVKLKDGTFFLFSRTPSELKESYADAMRLFEAKELEHVSMWASVHSIEFQPLIMCLISKNMSKFLIREEFDLMEIASSYNYEEI
jgi:hypothetical protein